MTQSTSQDLRRDQAAHRWTRSILQDRDQEEWTPEQWEEKERSLDYQNTFQLVRLLLEPRDNEEQRPLHPVLQIVYERFFQKTLWSIEHDLSHVPGELARAAAAHVVTYAEMPYDFGYPRHFNFLGQILYPWTDGRKERTTTEDLMIAGAFLVAEFERHLRSEGKTVF